MSRSRRLRAIALAMAAAALAGCEVGPNFARPEAPTPKTSGFLAAAPAAAAANEPPANWWRLYDSPAIDELVQGALVHNKSLL